MFAALPLLCAGCLTGHALEAGRIQESVLRYERAFSNDQRLLLGYQVELGDRNGASLGRARREVALRLVDLQSQPELRVDRFPVERVRIADEIEPGDREIELATKSRDGRDVGFQLLDEALKPRARFHSSALYRTHRAWWVYPLLPFTAALDLALFVPQIVAAGPLFLAGE